MRASAIGDARWSQVRELIADSMGLDLPHPRRADTERRLAGAADELGFDDVATYVDALLSMPLDMAQIKVLATHLTIGETYFFREKLTFDALRNSVLPELIRSRRGREQRLRLWSAGCCTGEEPYSLAILVRQLLPDLADWNVTILATDINTRFLQRAVAGSYGGWAFRDAPAGLKERYFTRGADGRHVVVPEIREMVTFGYLNMAEDVYPALATDTNAMDLILCRNVLLYFAAAQVRSIIGNLSRTLVDGGILVVSPSEASGALFPQFETRNFPGAILFQKSDANARQGQTPWPVSPVDAAASILPALDLPRPPSAATPWATEPPRATEPLPVLPPMEEAPADTRAADYAMAASLYGQGRFAEAADALLAWCAAHTPGPAAFSLLTRTLANLGRLAEALTWCDGWIAADKVDPSGHYLHAVILLEQGDHEQARRSLQRAVYLHPDFVLAHFAMGNLARRHGQPAEVDRHFATALHLLGRHQPDDPLPEADGLTAGRLTEIITALTALVDSR